MTQQPKSKEPRLIRWANDGYPPIDMSKETDAVLELIRAYFAQREAYAEQQRGCGRWVSVEERLPDQKPNEYVIVFDRGTDDEIKAIAFWDGEYFQTLHKKNINDKNIKWLDESPCECQGLREAAGELLHLHLCEQEGLQSGQPTFEMWFNAVNKLSKALAGDAGNKEE